MVTPLKQVTGLLSVCVLARVLRRDRGILRSSRSPTTLCSVVVKVVWTASRIMDSAGDNKAWYDANCHCRRIRLRLRISPLYASADSSAATEPFNVINCNCSICTKNGYLNVYPHNPDEDIEWISGKDELKKYQFAQGNVGHMFCPNCGSSVVLLVDFSKFVEGGRAKVGVNVSAGFPYHGVHHKFGSHGG